MFCDQRQGGLLWSIGIWGPQQKRSKVLCFKVRCVRSHFGSRGVAVGAFLPLADARPKDVAPDRFDSSVRARDLHNAP